MKSLRGVALIICAVSLFSITSGLVKFLYRIPAGEVVFFRSALAIPVILIWLSARGSLRTDLRTKNPLGHFSRSVAGTIAMGLGFFGLKLLPLPEVTALGFVLPILIVILAAIFLGERIRLARISAVFIGLIGVLIILWPRLGGGIETTGSREMLGVTVVLGAAAFAATAQIFIKRMAGVEHTAAIVFYFAFTSTILSLLSLPFGWQWPTMTEFAILTAIGILGGMGQICLTSAYRFADASTLAPFTYLSMLWALAIGYFFFGELPTLLMLLGASLVILAGVLIVLREHFLARRDHAV